MNKIIFDLNKYPDIDLDEFIEWFEKNYFKPFGEISAAPLFMDKYEVVLYFHRDKENNKYSITAKIIEHKFSSDHLFIRHKES